MRNFFKNFSKTKIIVGKEKNEISAVNLKNFFKGFYEKPFKLTKKEKKDRGGKIELSILQTLEHVSIKEFFSRGDIDLKDCFLIKSQIVDFFANYKEMLYSDEFTIDLFDESGEFFSGSTFFFFEENNEIKVLEVFKHGEKFSSIVFDFEDCLNFSFNDDACRIVIPNK